VIKRLNPIIRGWAAHYRTQVSSKTFDALENYLWQLTYKWAAFSHTNKPTSWVITQYFGMFNKARHDRWVFGDRHSGAYLHRFAWTNITRHQIVTGRSSPDDPALTEYWPARRRKIPLPVNRTHQWLYRAQDGRCHTCHGTLPPPRTARKPRPIGNAGWSPTTPPSRRSRYPSPARRATLNPV
jgi:RNA-directed DNA polymerase